MSTPSPSRLALRNVTFMTRDPARLADFWAAALGFTERRDEDGEVLIADAEWSRPRFTFQRVDGDEGAARPQSVHVDLSAAEDRVAEVARLVALGAEERRSVSMDDGWTWTVLADPDGNEFCVTDP